MRRIFSIIMCGLTTLILSYCIVYEWHQYEHTQNVWYGKNIFEVQMEAGEKKLKYNWTEEQTLDYYNRKCDSLKLIPPRECPYCFCRNLIEEYHGTEE